MMKFPMRKQQKKSVRNGTRLFVIKTATDSGFQRKLSGNLRRAAEMQKLMHGSMHLQERSVHRLICRAFGID